MPFMNLRAFSASSSAFNASTLPSSYQHRLVDRGQCICECARCPSCSYSPTARRDILSHDRFLVVQQMRTELPAGLHSRAVSSFSVTAQIAVLHAIDRKDICETPWMDSGRASATGVFASKEKSVPLALAERAPAECSDVARLRRRPLLHNQMFCSVKTEKGSTRSRCRSRAPATF